MRFSVVLLALLTLAVLLTAGAAEEATASPVDVVKDELQANINIV